MKTPQRFFLFLALSFLLSLTRGQFALATELTENWYGARALGMGNAFSSVVDDATALFYNPAALDRIKDYHLTVLGANAGADTTNFYNIYQNLTGNNFAASIQQYYGQNIWIGANDLLALSMKDFAVAGFDQVIGNFVLHNPAYPNLTVNVAEDYGEMLGGAFNLTPDDSIRLGFSAKRITRYGGQINMGAAQLATLSNSQINSLINNYGTGYGLDVGALFELPGASKPTFSFAWHDVGQTAFAMQGGTNTLAPIDNDLVAGFSMLFSGGGFGLRPAIDFTHINLSNEQIGKRLQAGIELTLPIISIRGGFNQGYYTAGAGIDLKYLRIDAATYGEELDTYPGQLEDRRYMLQLTVDLDFDLNFKLQNGTTPRAYERR